MCRETLLLGTNNGAGPARGVHAIMRSWDRQAAGLGADNSQHGALGAAMQPLAAASVRLGECCRHHTGSTINVRARTCHRLWRGWQEVQWNDPHGSHSHRVDVCEGHNATLTSWYCKCHLEHPVEKKSGRRMGVRTAVAYWVNCQKSQGQHVLAV
jgi:hypothetical protein